MEKNLTLVINPGSTSTKLALFRGSEQLFKKTMQHSTEQLATLKVTDQLDFRAASVYEFFKECGVDPQQLTIVACRGGQLANVEGGVYKVTKYMRDVLTYAPHMQHASNLACLIGNEIAEPLGIPVIMSDAPSSDEFDDVARIIGIPDYKIIPGSHILNSREVSRRVAASMGKRYEDCNFIVLHLGGGVSVNVHRKGRIVDGLSHDVGPMSPERAGRIPSRFVISLAFSGKYTEAELRKYMMGGGGVFAHLGTQDMFEVENRVKSGEEKATELIYAMSYQVAKGIGELSTVLYGDVDRIIITGSLARFAQLVDWVKERVSFIAPVEVIPGEFEMEALANAAVRVQNGEETPKEYTRPPVGYESIEAFYAAFPEAR